MESVEQAIDGAKDIMAEWMSEHPQARKQLRAYWLKEAVLTSKLAKGKEEEAQKYKDYFQWRENLRQPLPTEFWPCCAVKTKAC